MQKELQVRVGDKVRLRAGAKENALHIEKYSAKGVVAQVYGHGSVTVNVQRADGTTHAVLTHEDAVERVHSAAPGMRGLLEDVRAFHEIAGHPVGSEPGAQTFAQMELRVRLITEEVVKS